MENKYALFTWADYEAHGGFDDFEGFFNSIEDAQEYFEKNKNINYNNWESAHIYDMENRCIVLYYNSEEIYGPKGWIKKEIEVKND